MPKNSINVGFKTLTQKPNSKWLYTLDNLEAYWINSLQNIVWKNNTVHSFTITEQCNVYLFTNFLY